MEWSRQSMDAAAYLAQDARIRAKSERAGLELSMGRALHLFFGDFPGLSMQVGDVDRQQLAAEFVSRVLEVARA